jgi:ligand-binding sensor protein/AraC-like DNA-binding protein
MSVEEQLRKTINIEKWQILQDALSDVTRLAIITAEYKGQPITVHSGLQPFCKQVRNDPALSKICQKCDSRGGLEAMRIQEPYIYRCHMDNLDAAIPITVNSAYLGAILIGQVRLSSEEDMGRFEAIHSPMNLNAYGTNGVKYEELRKSIPVISYERLKVIVNMLFHLCNYFVGEALEKAAILKILTGYNSNITGLSKEELECISIRRLELIKSDLNDIIYNAKVSGDENHINKIQSKILEPAFTYIDSHKSERLFMRDMAKLCHICPSYFSKLFKKETKENYSSYLLKMRVEWAKSLLISTDMKISQIAEEAGFSDSGHLVRSFKNQEGVSPALFKRMLS